MKAFLAGLFSRLIRKDNDTTTTITLDYGTFRGKNVKQTISFLGIPFGQTKRFEVATLYSSSLQGIQDATKYGKVSPQMKTDIFDGTKIMGIKIDSLMGLFIRLFIKTHIQQESEDECLNINVQIPLDTSPDAKLPVAFFIHGGAYLIGSGDINGMGTGIEGINLVTKSIKMKKPIIFVSANHRLNIFGLLAGKDITEAGASNLLLRDQRLAMQWVQKYIHKFGGDPTKVTLIGGSAGSFATSMHLLLDDGDPKGLYRGAMMFSGGANRLASQNAGQAQFDSLAKFCNCDQAEDKFACLKKVPEKMLRDYLSSLPNPSTRGMVVPFNPRPDGSYLKGSPFEMVKQGKMANVPIVIGDMMDEGTIFSLILRKKIRTEEQVKDWIKTVLFPKATDAEVDKLLQMYPDDQATGSPFNSGDSNNISPQFKRLAAIQGDAWFHCGRRNILNNAPNENKWTYQTEINMPITGRKIPIVGSMHGMDIVLNMFGDPSSNFKPTEIIMTSVISFVNDLDPNNDASGNTPWPRYTSEAKQMYHIKNSGADVIRDDFRSIEIQYLMDTENFQL